MDWPSPMIMEVVHLYVVIDCGGNEQGKAVW